MTDITTPARAAPRVRGLLNRVGEWRGAAQMRWSYPIAARINAAVSEALRGRFGAPDLELLFRADEP